MSIRDDAAAEITRLDCSAVIADVWLLLDDECDTEARIRVEQHLAECGSCLQHYGIEERVKAVISRGCRGERAPEGLRSRLIIEFTQTMIVHGD